MTKYNRQWQHLYDHKWNKYSKLFLKLNPLCVYCLQLGVTTPSAVVDHIKRHLGNVELFNDTGNHQALCKHCHDSFKAREEATGTLPGCSVDGMPLDVNHDWNK